MIDSLKEWSKEAKIEMIRRSWKHKNLALATGMSTGYVTSVVNVRVISEKAIVKISKALDIQIPEEFCKKNVS